MISFYSIPVLIAAFLSLFLGFFVYAKNWKNFLNNSLALLCFNIAVWLFCYSIVYASKSEHVALFWARNSYLGIIFIPVTIYQLAIVILGFRGRKLLIIFYLLGVFFVFMSRTNLFFDHVKLFFWGYYPQAAKLYFLFLIFFFGIYSYGTILLGFALLKRHFNFHKRNQILYVFFAYIVGSLASIDFLGKYGIEFYPFGYVCMVLIVFIFSYAIIRYRLMDIRIAVTRTGIFVAVYSLVLGVPFALAFGCQERLIQILGVNWWILPLISSTALATIGPFIYLYINKKAEDRLMKKQRSYQNILRNASSGMIRIKDLKRLLNVVVHVITKTVKIKYAAVYLLDKETNNFILQAARGRFVSGKQSNYIDTGSPLIWQLSLRKNPIVTEEEVMKLRDEAQNQGVIKFVEQLLKLDASLVVPSFVDDKLTGILILGEKASGKLYSEDDLVVFSVLANQSALAIENAQFYDEVKRTHEQLFQAEKMATIGTMADGLSHQINNRFHALSLIAGDSLDFLKHSDMSSFSAEAKLVLAELKNALERIENNVLQGGEVVRGLLKYSRPGESGFELVSFKDVLNGSIDMVQYKIKLKEFDLVQNIADDAPKLYGNLTQLQEVFFNLIDNAYDAIKERQILLKEDGFRGKIEVSAIGVEGALEIIVADNGMGVKDLDKKKLFTPFFTTKATAKKGTGLGLYVLDKIIGAHNGKISIDSIYKSGTRFTITLPISPKS
jgi:signal transduction histidine kinase